MVTIPRYQSRTGAPLRGQAFPQAFGPGYGEGFRDFAQLAAATGAVVDGARTLWGLHERKEAGRASPDPEQAEADEQEILLRAELLRRGDHGAAMDPAAVDHSMGEAAAQLSPAARAIFEQKMAPRAAAWRAHAEATSESLRSAQREAMAVQREVLGVEEYVRHANSDETLGRLALASAVAQRGERLTAAGLAADAVKAGKQALMAEAEALRIRRAVGEDPAKAAGLLARHGAVLGEQEREALGRDIAAEQTRVDAAQAVAKIAERKTGLAEDLEALAAEAETAAGEDPDRRAAYRSAALGLWRAQTAARDAAEEAGWQAAEEVLDPQSGVRSWTAVPGPVWAALSERQRDLVKGWLDDPGRESDPGILSWAEAMARENRQAFGEIDLTSLGAGLSRGDYTDLRGLQRSAREGGAQWSRDRDNWLGNREDSPIPQDGSGLLLRVSTAGQSPAAATKPKPRPKPEIQPRPPRANELPIWFKVYSEYPKRIPLRKDANGRDDVFGLAIAYETGGKNDVVSTGIGDPGGKSYGRLQFSSNDGIPEAFLKSDFGRAWRDRFSKSPGAYYPSRREPSGKQGEFEKLWREIDAGPEGEAFRKAQENFARKTYLEPALAHIKATTGLDLSKSSAAVQAAIYSTASHHSTKLYKEILDATFDRIRDGSIDAYDDVGAYRGQITESNFIDALYQTRREIVLERVPKFSPRRFDLERESALDLLKQQQGNGVAPMFMRNTLPEPKRP